MIWHRHLYVGEAMADRLQQLKDRLEKGDVSERAYLITLGSRGQNQLEIIPTSALRSERVLKNLPVIVGAAADRKEAFSLTVKMTEDCLKKTGSARIRRMFEEDFED